MAKKNTSETLLTDCEPYFLEGTLVVAEFARRTQKLIREVVDAYSFTSVLGFPMDEMTQLGYCWPDKLQKANGNEALCLGTKIKVRDVPEIAIYRYWKGGGTGVEFYIWIKGREKLDHLSDAINNLPDELPGPEESWDWGQDGGTYYLLREVTEAEVARIGVILPEFIGYCVQLLRGIGGVERFVK